MGRLVMLIGIPASGKSTYADKLEKNLGYIIHSSDKLRQELYNNIDTQDKNQELFEELHKRIKRDLNNGLNVAYDACSINFKKRIEFLKSIKHIKDIETIAILFATPYEQCLEQNKKRDRIIPEYVIERMYRHFNVPMYCEGWDKIEVVYGDTSKYTREYMLETLDFDQENPNHTLTAKEHCMQTCHELWDLTENNNLLLAGVMHDIGKRFTKTFVNKKGETTDNAHYYDHEYVGAYESLMYTHNDSMLTVDDCLEIAKYIQFHMLHYHDLNDKSVMKYRKLLGAEFMDNLTKLNIADKKAH